MGFGLSIGMRIETKQRLEQKTEIKIGPELKQSIIMGLSQLQQEFSLKSPEVRELVYKTAVDLLVQKFEEAEARLPPQDDPHAQTQSQQIREIFLGDTKQIFITLLEKHSSALLKKEYKTALFRTLLDLGYSQYEKDKTTLGNIIEAIENPEKIRAEIEFYTRKIQEIKDEDKETALGLARQLSEYQTALEYAEIFEANVAVHFIPLIEMIQQTELSGRKILEDYQVDSMLESELIRNFQVPEKILERISQRLKMDTGPKNRKTIGETYTIPQRIKDTLSNAIGQVILISLGIIDKDLFVLMKGEAADQTVAKDFQELTGKDLKTVLARHNLEGQTGFRFHRYRTLLQPPTIETDNAIRSFITTQVREYQEDILTQIKFEKKFFRLIEDLNDQKDKDQMTEDGMFSDFIQNLFDENFYRYLEELTRNKFVKPLKEQQLL